MRQAHGGDTASIAAVLQESFREFEPLYTPEAYAATTPSFEGVLERMKEGPVWVVLEDDSVIGTISVVATAKGLYLRGMGIVPQARGQHIGRWMLEQVQQFAAEQGHRRMLLSTTPFLAQAIRLYERFGFRRTEEGPHHMFGTPLFTMEKLL